MDDKVAIKETEKDILKKFTPLRLNYPDTERATEWIRIDATEIQNIFKNYREVQGVKHILTRWQALRDAPPLSVVEKVIREPRRQTKVELVDGTIVPATGGLSNLQRKFNANDVRVVKNIDPMLFKWLQSHGISVEDIADEIRARYTDQQIEKRGGFEELIVFLGREAQRRNANDARFIRHLKRIGRLER